MVAISEYEQAEGHRARIARRNIVEAVCEIAEERLPRRKKLLFLLYWRHGYRKCDIGELLGKAGGTVHRELGRIAGELGDIDAEIRRRAAGGEARRAGAARTGRELGKGGGRGII